MIDMYDETLMSNASSASHDTGVGKGNIYDTPRPTTANPAGRNHNASHSLPWRRRPKSLILVDDDFQDDTAIEDAHTNSRHDEQDDAQRSGASFKGKLRRASLSLARGMSMVRHHRRTSEPAVEPQEPIRPSTSHSPWNRLRQATSFRNSRMPQGLRRGGLETIYSPVESSFPDVLVPGHGREPPIIPRHTGGAAKAAAAMQNEYLAFARQRQEWFTGDDLQNDGESGIGIALAATDTEREVAAAQDGSIVRIDLISQLPSELAIHVLSFLDAAQIGTVSRVCKLWYVIAQDSQVWRQSFLREKTGTYATSLPVQPGTGSGVPVIRPGNDWRKIYKARHELEKRWKIGKQTRAVYLNGHTDSIYCLQFDENKIITGSRDKTVRIWDMHTLQCRLIIGPPEAVNETSILFDREGKPVHFAATPDNERTHPSVPVTVSFPMHHKQSILCLQYDDNILVTGSSDGTCIIHSVRSGYRPVRRLQFHSEAVLDLAFDDKHIVTCSKDHSICVWDRETGTMLKQLKGHTGPVNAVQLRGNTIVSCSGDYRVKMWNIDSGKTIREFVGHTKGLACSQFSEDGRYIASAGSDKVVRIWDANSGELLREIQAHENLVRSLHIDSVSGRLISASYDTNIKVFNMATGDQVLDFPCWHSSWVLSAKCDYRRIVSTGQDPKILIMDFGAGVPGIELLESTRKHDTTYEAGFI